MISSINYTKVKVFIIYTLLLIYWLWWFFRFQLILLPYVIADLLCNMMPRMPPHQRNSVLYMQSDYSQTIHLTPEYNRAGACCIP